MKSNHVPSGTENWQHGRTVKVRRCRNGKYVRCGIMYQVVVMESGVRTGVRVELWKQQQADRSTPELVTVSPYGLRFGEPAASGNLLLLVKHKEPRILLVGKILKITAIRLPESGKYISSPPTKKTGRWNTRFVFCDLTEFRRFAHRKHIQSDARMNLAFFKFDIITGLTISLYQ